MLCDTVVCATSARMVQIKEEKRSQKRSRTGSNVLFEFLKSANLMSSQSEREKEKFAASIIATLRHKIAGVSEEEIQLTFRIQRARMIFFLIPLGSCNYK